MSIKKLPKIHPVKPPVKLPAAGFNRGISPKAKLFNRVNPVKSAKGGAKQFNRVNWRKLNGLIPVIAQDFKTDRILMLGFMNKEALQKTLKEGKVTYWSRTRKKLWTKGESSGNFQLVKEIYLDCDNDTLLIKVKQIGNVCHTGNKTCFFRKIL